MNALQQAAFIRQHGEREALLVLLVNLLGTCQQRMGEGFAITEALRRHRVGMTFRKCFQF
ncbi:hypothetical protein C7S18_06650 [Ahniella affigens]|uniref:Uncharacterized protein n=1 Tax=Ahniella affigens TaxID=2021234 RepID=A0A2P1PPZ4_9GAMM|nr:hypothetical protein C7S18_06650 [Ahniella affigens]